MVESELVQDGGLVIVDVEFVIDWFVAVIIGEAVSEAPFTPPVAIHMAKALLLWSRPLVRCLCGVPPTRRPRELRDPSELLKREHPTFVGVKLAKNLLCIRAAQRARAFDESRRLLRGEL